MKKPPRGGWGSRQISTVPGSFHFEKFCGRFFRGGAGGANRILLGIQTQLARVRPLRRFDIAASLDYAGFISIVAAQFDCRSMGIGPEFLGRLLCVMGGPVRIPLHVVNQLLHVVFYIALFGAFATTGREQPNAAGQN